jgi:Flp pilus assembly protein TadG
MRRLRQFLIRLGERGNATIEFGLIGTAYVMMILGALEMGYMLFIQSVLDNASRDAARLIRTGQAQTASNPQTTFQNLLCGDVSWLITCSSIYYQSTAFWTWSETNTGLQTAPTRDSNGNIVSTGFDAGSPGEIVLVQVFYNYSFFTPWIGSLLGAGLSNTAYLSSTVIFQNEPF